MIKKLLKLAFKITYKIIWFFIRLFELDEKIEERRNKNVEIDYDELKEYVKIEGTDINNMKTAFDEGFGLFKGILKNDIVNMYHKERGVCVATITDWLFRIIALPSLLLTLLPTDGLSGVRLFWGHVSADSIRQFLDFKYILGVDERTGLLFLPFFFFIAFIFEKILTEIKCWECNLTRHTIKRHKEELIDYCKAKRVEEIQASPEYQEERKKAQDEYLKEEKRREEKRKEREAIQDEREAARWERIEEKREDKLKALQEIASKLDEL